MASSLRISAENVRKELDDLVQRLGEATTPREEGGAANNTSSSSSHRNHSSSTDLTPPAVIIPPLPLTGTVLTSAPNLSATNTSTTETTPSIDEYDLNMADVSELIVPVATTTHQVHWRAQHIALNGDEEPKVLFTADSTSCVTSTNEMKALSPPSSFNVDLSCEEKTGQPKSPRTSAFKSYKDSPRGSNSSQQSTPRTNEKNGTSIPPTTTTTTTRQTDASTVVAPTPIREDPPSPTKPSSPSTSPLGSRVQQLRSLLTEIQAYLQRHVPSASINSSSLLPTSPTEKQLVDALDNSIVDCNCILDTMYIYLSGTSNHYGTDSLLLLQIEEHEQRLSLIKNEYATLWLPYINSYWSSLLAKLSTEKTLRIVAEETCGRNQIQNSESLARSDTVSSYYRIFAALSQTTPFYPISPPKQSTHNSLLRAVQHKENTERTRIQHQEREGFTQLQSTDNLLDQLKDMIDSVSQSGTPPPPSPPPASPTPPPPSPPLNSTRSMDNSVGDTNLGRLYVTVMEGKHLPYTTLVGLPDAFALVYISKQVHATAVVKQSSNPVWQSLFEFSVPLQPPNNRSDYMISTSSLLVEVHEKEAPKRSILGRAVIKLHHLMQDQPTTIICNLSDKNGQTGSTVSLILHAINFGLPPPPPPPPVNRNIAAEFSRVGTVPQIPPPPPQQQQQQGPIDNSVQYGLQSQFDSTNYTTTTSSSSTSTSTSTCISTTLHGGGGGGGGGITMKTGSTQTQQQQQQQHQQPKVPPIALSKLTQTASTGVSSPHQQPPMPVHHYDNYVVPYLGLELSEGILLRDTKTPDTADMKVQYGGVRVLTVHPPAMQAGIYPGDFICKVCGIDIISLTQFKEVMRTVQAGQIVYLILIRNGVTLQRQVTATARDGHRWQVGQRHTAKILFQNLPLHSLQTLSANAPPEMLHSMLDAVAVSPRTVSPRRQQQSNTGAVRSYSVGDQVEGIAQSPPSGVLVSPRLSEAALTTTSMNRLHSPPPQPQPVPPQPVMLSPPRNLSPAHQHFPICLPAEHPPISNTVAHYTGPHFGYPPAPPQIADSAMIQRHSSWGNHKGLRRTRSTSPSYHKLSKFGTHNR